MKADFDHDNGKRERSTVPAIVGYVLLFCGVLPLLALFVGFWYSLGIVILLAAVLTAVCAKIFGSEKNYITADENGVVVTKGKNSRVIPMDGISAAGYNAELVQNRFGDWCIIKSELRLTSGEVIRLEKRLDLPYGLKCSVHSDVAAFAEDQPLPQLCRYINRQVLGIAEE